LIGDELGTVTLVDAQVVAALASPVTVTAQTPNQVMVAELPVTITIQGTNLNEVTQVYAGAATAAIVAPRSDTLLTVVVAPTTDLTQLILVDEIAGEEIPISAGYLRAIDPLEVVSVTPGVVGYKGGDIGEISGADFAPDIKLFINDVPTPVATITNNERLTFTIPPGQNDLSLRLEQHGQPPLLLPAIIQRQDDIEPTLAARGPFAATNVSLAATFFLEFSEPIDRAVFEQAHPFYLTTGPQNQIASMSP
jgi:hypothetical protein